MAFYIRKAIKAGPFRFNLSKSGIGVSAGIKGLRIGSGPRGNYIHMGRGGLYYRKTLNSRDDSRVPKPMPVKHWPPKSEDDMAANPEYTNYREIESGDIFGMTDSSSVELLAEFDSKRKKWRLWPWVAGLCAVTFIMLSDSLPAWAVWMLLGLEAAAIYVTYNYDQIRKSVILFYDMEPDFEKAYEGLHTAFQALQSSHKSWHVESQADVIDRKRHAGADQAISRKPVSIKTDKAPYVKTNISVPSLPVGKQTLFFFPDRLLVFESNHVGAVSYGDLSIDIADTRFIEHGGVPKDAQVVDHTWQYVNKSGGPDKRFNNNRQLPICLYEDMHLTSNTGLNELVEFSKRGNADGFRQATKELSQILSTDDSSAKKVA